MIGSIRKIAIVSAAALVALAAYAAAPPWSVDVNVAPAAVCDDGSSDLALCPVLGYELFLDGNLVGAVNTGANADVVTLTQSGTYVFRVDTLGPVAGERTVGTDYTYQVTALKSPGKVTLTISTDCSPCLETVQ